MRFQLKVWGNVLVAPTPDRLSYLVLHKYGLMARGVRQVIGGLVRTDMSVVDAGANVGLYTGLFSQLAGSGGKVISIEPESANWHALTDSIRENKWSNVEAHNCALDESSGSVILIKDRWNSGNHSVIKKGGSNIGVSERVQARTIDEIVGGRKVDLIKIDVQGFELNVLKGAQSTLNSNENISVLLEVWPKGLWRNGVLVEDVFAFLERFSFSFVEPATRKPYVYSNTKSYQDVLAVRM
jgi:FkbM family methyltransferase